MKKILLQNKQFLLYCIIGASGVGLHGLLYGFFIEAGLLQKQAAYAIGYASGTLLTFFLNARFNFKTNDRIALRLVAFGSVALLGWAISAFTLHLLVDRFGMNRLIAFFPTVLLVVFLQYNFNRLLSFRKVN